MTRKIRIALNIILFAIVIAVWLYMFKSSESFLSSPGLTNLKYFTVLSNLYAGVTSLVWAVFAIKDKDRKDAYKTADILKYTSTVALMVTFCVVLFFLKPLYRDLPMYSGANFWFHLIIPLWGIIEFIIFNKTKLGIKENLYTGVPAFIYGLCYLLNILINGKGEWPDSNDWYGFLNWGLPVGLVIFMMIVLISVLLGFFIRGMLKIRYKFLNQQNA
ncbi:MAG: hypothetical protein J6U54_21730 [Clostridiales bacterium]|nr:hypothetical protein [Clostridiales bacterium]